MKYSFNIYWTYFWFTYVYFVLLLYYYEKKKSLDFRSFGSVL